MNIVYKIRRDGQDWQLVVNEYGTKTIACADVLDLVFDIPGYVHLAVLQLSSSPIDGGYDLKIVDDEWTGSWKAKIWPFDSGYIWSAAYLIERKFFHGQTFWFKVSW